MKADTAKLIADNLLHVSFTATLIGVIYLAYLPRLERGVQLRTTDEIMRGFGQDLADIIPKDQRKADLDHQARAALRVPNMSERDAAARVQNKRIRHRTIVALVLLNIGAVVGIAAAYRSSPFDLRRMLKHTAVVSLTAGAVYLFFSSIILRDFHTVDPNTVKTTMLDTFATFNERCVVK